MLLTRKPPFSSATAERPPTMKVQPASSGFTTRVSNTIWNSAPICMVSGRSSRTAWISGSSACEASIMVWTSSNRGSSWAISGCGPAESPPVVSSIVSTMVCRVAQEADTRASLASSLDTRVSTLFTWVLRSAAALSAVIPAGPRQLLFWAKSIAAAMASEMALALSAIAAGSGLMAASTQSATADLAFFARLRTEAISPGVRSPSALTEFQVEMALSIRLTTDATHCSFWLTLPKASARSAARVKASLASAARSTSPQFPASVGGGGGPPPPPQPAIEIPAPGSLTRREPSSVTLPLATISKRSVAWSKDRKYITEPGARPRRLGISIVAGGSKVDWAGCRVQAKGEAIPSGIGMGISSKCTWLRDTGVPSGAGAPPMRIEPGWMRMASPSIPATVSTVSSLAL